MRIIGGKFSSRRLVSPKGEHVRPTADAIREKVFNICQRDIENKIFLDLCAGSGAMGLEALSRGAAVAYFVEKHPLSIRCIHKNIETLSLDSSQYSLFTIDALKALKIFKKKELCFDIIYIDPPYALKTKDKHPYGEALLEEIDTLSLLAPQGKIFLEEAKDTQIQSSAEHKHFSFKDLKSHGNTQIRYYSSLI